jgi:predicted nucleotidyltransferase
MVDLTLIQNLSERIAREFQPERIVLFGSYADGSPTADSDVDLLVVMPFKGKAMRKALEILSRVNPQFPVDLLVRTPEQVRERINNNDWFMREVFERGRVLYEANHA